MIIHSLHESRVAVSWLSSSQFVFECIEYRVIVMAGQANVSLNISDDAFDYASYRRRCDIYDLIINGYILAVVIIVGIIGNSLTFVVFWKGNFKSSTSFLFSSLSLADSALLLTNVPINIVRIFVKHTGWLQGFLNLRPYMTVYVYPLALVSRMTTIWVTVLIAVNRYIIVCVPLRASQWCTLSKVKRQLAVVLVVAVMSGIPRVFKYRVVISYTRDNGTSYTTATSSNLLGFYTAYDVVMYCILLSSVPLVFLTMLTVRLVKAMKAHRRMQLEMNHVSSKQDSSVTPAFLIVVIVFIICHTPMFVVVLLYYLAIWYNYKVMTMIEVYCFTRALARMLVGLNSAVNFAIYTLACKSFRDVLIENVCRRRTDMQVVIAHHEEGVNDEPDDDAPL